MKNALLTLSFLVAGLWSTAGAFAAETRVAWFYNGGYLVQDMRTKAWSETINAVEEFYFKEVSRNDTYVQLYDPTRKIDMRLYRDAMLLKGPNETQYRTHRQGRWDDRRMFYYYGGVKTGYFLLIGGGMYRLVDQSGPQPTSTYLREIRRLSDSVHLLDPRANVMYQLHNTELYKGAANSGAAYFESKGMWK